MGLKIFFFTSFPFFLFLSISLSLSLSLSLPLSDSFLLQVMFHTLTNWKNKQPMITYSLPKKEKKITFSFPFRLLFKLSVGLFVCLFFFVVVFFFQLIICVLKMSFVLYKRGRSRRRARSSTRRERPPC